MPRFNKCICKQRLSQNDGCYHQTLKLGELIIIQGRLTDQFYQSIGHIISFTAKQYRFQIRVGPIFRRSKTVYFNRNRGEGKSLKKKECPASHPAPKYYCPLDFAISTELNSILTQILRTLIGLKSQKIISQTLISFTRVVLGI